MFLKSLKVNGDVILCIFYLTHWQYYRPSRFFTPKIYPI